MEIDDRRTPDHELGALVAAGRDATIHDVGAGRVLRRTPTERDLRSEAEAMEHLRAEGYPIPEVFRVGPGEMVLERVSVWSAPSPAPADWSRSPGLPAGQRRPAPGRPGRAARRGHRHPGHARP